MQNHSRDSIFNRDFHYGCDVYEEQLLLLPSKNSKDYLDYCSLIRIFAHKWWKIVSDSNCFVSLRKRIAFGLTTCRKWNPFPMRHWLSTCCSILILTTLINSFHYLGIKRSSEYGWIVLLHRVKCFVRLIFFTLGITSEPNALKLMSKASKPDILTV